MAARIFLIGVLVCFAAVYGTYLSIFDYFFFHLAGFDILLHLLGGVWAGLIAAWFVIMYKQEPRLAQCIGFAIFCGIAIEILEYHSGFGRNLYMNYPLDTAKDILIDAIGGYGAFAMVRTLKGI